MVERSPIYLAVDAASDPSALALFTTGDTIPSANMPITISATNITTDNATINQNLSGAAAQYTGIVQFYDSVSSVSGLTTNQAITSSGGSIENARTRFPAEFCWLNMMGDGTNDTSYRGFGHGTTVAGVSSSDNFTWDETNDLLTVLAAGYWEVVLNAVVEVASAQTVEYGIWIDGTQVYNKTNTIHTLTDPHFVDVLWVGKIGKDETFGITRKADANVKFLENSSLLIKRIS